MEVFCNQCGHRNPQGARFCSSCGSPLEPLREDHTVTFTLGEPVGEAGDDEVQVTLDELHDRAALLVVKRGPNAGSRFVLEHEVTTLGRHPESEIFLDDITVSRRHAEIVRGEAGYVIRDVGSLNGTYLNRERIEQEAPLAPGDEVQIGKFRMVFFPHGGGE